jgi:uncharacterized phage protein (TIGR02216 family)
MAVGLGVLRLSPAAFWSMTPREFAAAAGWMAPAAARPTRADLGQLMQRFPDSERGWQPTDEPVGSRKGL